MFNHVQATKGAEEVHGTQDDGSFVTVAQTSGSENRGAIVEEKVGSSELLEHLQGEAEDDAVKHAWSGEDFIPRVVACTVSIRK